MSYFYIHAYVFLHVHVYVCMCILIKSTRLFVFATFKIIRTKEPITGREEIRKVQSRCEEPRQKGRGSLNLKRETVE